MKPVRLALRPVARAARRARFRAWAARLDLIPGALPPSNTIKMNTAIRTFILFVPLLQRIPSVGPFQKNFRREWPDLLSVKLHRP